MVSIRWPVVGVLGHGVCPENERREKGVTRLHFAWRCPCGPDGCRSFVVKTTTRGEEEMREKGKKR
ncbi:hypothetical protein HAX54_039182, partial [Datura stramonium]|nr:hypothetical protein [Datura stramonium]